MITTSSDWFLSNNLALEARGNDGEFGFPGNVSRIGEFSFRCGDPNLRGNPDN